MTTRGFLSRPWFQSSLFLLNAAWQGSEDIHAGRGAPPPAGEGVKAEPVPALSPGSGRRGAPRPARPEAGSSGPLGS